MFPFTFFLLPSRSPLFLFHFASSRTSLPHSSSSSSFFVCLHFFTSLTTIYSQANIRRARAQRVHQLAVAAWQVNTHDNTHLQYTYIYIYTCIISCSLFSPFCFTLPPSFLSFLSFFLSFLPHPHPHSLSFFLVFCTLLLF